MQAPYGTGAFSCRTRRCATWSTPPKSVAEIKAPASVAGPPSSVAVAPNEEIALVTGAMGVVWSSNSRKLLVQCMVEEQVYSFSWSAGTLAQTGTIKTTGGPAGLRTAEK